MFSQPDHAVLADFRYTLQVMEEGRHLGLDEQAADHLRRVLKRRIDRLEKAVEREANPEARLISIHRAKET